MATVSLVPMSAAAYEVWHRYAVAEYAADNVKAGRTTPENALAESQKQFDELLTDGPATVGQELWSVVDGAGEQVGILWIATDRRPGHAFIYDIEIEESRRGQGFGTATLAALDDWARLNGISIIGLHVFGHNTGAWQLYKRLGYVETSVQMEKHL